MSFKIDAVITWVDGDDPRHKAKREHYCDKRLLARDDVAGSTRYSSIGEIFYCVASLNRFAPWLNKIYIVTDEQNPMVEEFIAKHFSEGSIPMEIVDHKVIFRGYEEYIPTFNSISIESMTWRIPGLSEHYIEFNDDLILGAPTKPEDFFPTEDTVMCYGRRRSSFWVRLSRILKYRIGGPKRVSFKESMINGAELAGHKRDFIMLHHTPKALLKSVYERYFEEHPEALLRNISHRFRHASQYNPQEVFFLMLKDLGRCTMKRAEEELFYFMAKSDMGYIRRKLDCFTRNSGKKFGCFNSLDQVPIEGQKMVVEWIERRLQLR
jgi:hypothetical protein